MRIDSPTSVRAWLEGKFRGEFQGNLEGTASYAYYALSASYANTASYLTSEGFSASLNDALNDPNNESVFERLKSSGRLVVNGGIRVVSGNVEIDTGSLRIRKVVLQYLDDENALGFKFLSDSEIPPLPDTGSTPTGSPEPPTPPTPPPPPPYPWPWPPVPPVPPPPPPFPPYPPYPPKPPKPEPTRSVSPSIDYYREGRY